MSDTKPAEARFTIAENPALLAACLRNVAEALGPALANDQGTAATRDCINIVLRTAQALDVTAPGFSASADINDPAVWPAVVDEEVTHFAGQEASFAQAIGDLSKEKQGGRWFDREACEHYLQQQAFGGSALRITHARQLAGGRSKQTIQVGQTGATALPDELVIRQDWAAGGVQGTTVVEEFALLRRIAESGLKVPQPLHLERSSDALGAPFMLMTRMAGTQQGDYFKPCPSERMALQLAEQLARLHTLPISGFAAMPVRVDANTAEALRSALDSIRKLCAQFGDHSPTIAVALQWLDRNCEHVKHLQALIHNDIACHNLLVDNGNLSAILDWELASIGHPAADLGYARGWLEKIVPWQRLMEAYGAAGGPAIDDLTLDFYTLWSGVRLYSMLLQARAGIAMGKIHDLEITSICADSTPRLLQRIARELQHALRRG